MATVYDKSSLFLAPSGVSNGTVFVQKPVPIYGSEQVTNGDFSQEGAELITNGDFANDADWTKGTGWSISGGSANCDGTQTSNSVFYQNISSQSNKTVKFSFTVTDYVSGVVETAFFGAAGTITETISANGDYTFYINVQSGHNGNTGFTAKVGFNGSIDNVSVKEVGQDWVFGGSGSNKATIGDNSATITSVDGNSYLQQNSVLTSGKNYKISYEIISSSAATNVLKLASSFGISEIPTSGGTHAVYGIAISSTLYVERYTNGVNATITNISVQEVLSPDGDFTFTRGSNLSATRVNEAQLIEKGRENLILQSNQFDTTWTNTSSAETSGFEGYDGTNNAWKLEKTGNGGRLRQTISLSGVNTFSVYAKAGTTKWLRLLFETISDSYYFDLENGVLGSSTSQPVDGNIESVGNGWYRCSVTGSGTIGAVRIYPADDDLDVTGTSGSVYIQDAQLEQGLVATSVITTGAVPVQAGLLENTPRLDYSGGATCPSLLLEPPRTNDSPYSEYISAFNNLSAINVNDNATDSPEGVSNAAFIYADATSNQHYISNNHSYTSGTAFTISIFVKVKDYDYFFIRAQDFLSPSTTSFNLSNGTLAAAGGEDSYTIESFNSDWYRISATYTPTSTTANNNGLRLGFSPTTSYNYTGDNSSGGYVYGYQFENNASYPTSYIPTYGTSQTRVADGCVKTGISSLIGQTEGTIYLEADIQKHNEAGFYIAISDGAQLGNALYVYQPSSGTLTVLVRKTGNPSDGVIQVTSSNWTAGINKLAIAYTSTTAEFFINGFSKGTTTFSSLASFTNLTIGSRPDGVGLLVGTGGYKQAILFPKVLSDLQLAILTGATTYETFDEMALALNYTVYE